MLYKPPGAYLFLSPKEGGLMGKGGFLIPNEFYYRVIITVFNQPEDGVNSPQRTRMQSGELKAHEFGGHHQST